VPPRARHRQRPELARSTLVSLCRTPTSAGRQHEAPTSITTPRRRPIPLSRSPWTTHNPSSPCAFICHTSHGLPSHVVNGRLVWGIASLTTRDCPMPSLAWGRIARLPCPYNGNEGELNLAGVVPAEGPMPLTGVIVPEADGVERNDIWAMRCCNQPSDTTRGDSCGVR